MLVDKVSRSGKLLAVLILGLVPLSYITNVRALPLGVRSVRIDNSQVSSNTTHVFSHDIPSMSLVGSTVFEYCTNSPLLFAPCSPPAGMNAASANLDSETGDTGYTVHGLTSANRVVLTRIPIISTPGISQYVLSNIVNPSDTGTVYVRVTLHASNDGTGPSGDGGAVVFSLTKQLSTLAFVPPYLTFCVGITVTADCSDASGNSIDFGEFSRLSPKTSTSQFAGATNDSTGYFTNLVANTMTSGSDVINPLATPTGSSAGTSQFGLNLRANSNPSVGKDPTGIGSSAAAPDYAIANQFILRNGVITASNLSTDFNVFTMSYMVNVSANQAPGVYSTTLTFVATAAF